MGQFLALEISHPYRLAPRSVSSISPALIHVKCVPSAANMVVAGIHVWRRGQSVALARAIAQRIDAVEAILDLVAKAPIRVAI